MHMCVCACVYLPLGGGLMSVSPCWLELSDCPDSAETKEESSHVFILRIKTEIAKKKKKKEMWSMLLCHYACSCYGGLKKPMGCEVHPVSLMYNDLLCSAMLYLTTPSYPKL